VSTADKIAANIIPLSKLTRSGTAGQILTSGGAGADPSWQNAPSGGVTSVNGNTGAVTAGQIAAAATAGYGYTPANSSHSHSYAGLNAIVSISNAFSGGQDTCTATRADGSTFSFYTSTSSGGACLHPHTFIDTPTGQKAICDLRPGDTVLIPGAFDEVLGLWESTLGSRSLVCVNGKVVVTPGHLFQTVEGHYVAYDPEEFYEHDQGIVRPVKTLQGMLRITSSQQEVVGKLAIGQRLRTPGGWEWVETLEEFEINQPSLPVYSLVLKDSPCFYADGILTQTLNG
jgi:hypothetical protein